MCILALNYLGHVHKAQPMVVKSHLLNESGICCYVSSPFSCEALEIPSLMYENRNVWHLNVYLFQFY